MVRHSLGVFMASRAADILIRLIVVLSVVGSGAALMQNRETADRNRDLTECVAAYNNANNLRSEILTRAADEERVAERRADDAMAALILSPLVSKPAAQRTPTERAEVLRLFRSWQSALSDQSTERAAADDARRINPIPDPPSEVCD